MRSSRTSAAATLATVLAIAFASFTPVARAGAQNNNSIFVDDFAVGQRSASLTSTVALRRGVTTKVQITKDFINLVRFEDIGLAGGGSISLLRNGQVNGNGMGFIAMSITVLAGHTVGSSITLVVGSGDRFTFNVVHRGEISTVGKSPDPATVPVRTPWVATIQGTDIGGVVVNPAGVTCHTITHTGRTANAVTVTLTHNATCSTTAFGIALQGNSTNDPPSYNLASGAVPGFQFAYAPAGVACVSQPNLGQPTIQAPLSGQTLFFRSGTTSPVNVRISWDSLTSGDIPAPNNEWIVTLLSQRSALPGNPNSFTVKGLSTSLRFALPDTHRVTVRAKNCGLSAPGTTFNFSTLFQ